MRSCCLREVRAYEACSPASAISSFLYPGGWGRSFTSAMDDYPRMAGMWLVGEDMPQESNRITLSKAKDKYGMPVADAHFDDHPNDIAMRNHGFKQGAAIYEAVGPSAASHPALSLDP